MPDPTAHHPPPLRPWFTPSRLGLLALLALLAPGPALTSAPGMLTGRISYTDGTPALDAAAWIGAQQAPANAEGVYGIPLPSGKHTVRCMAKDARPRQAVVQVKAGAITVHDCVLVRLTPVAPPPVARHDAEDRSHRKLLAGAPPAAAMDAVMEGQNIGAGLGGLGTRGTGSGGGGEGSGRTRGMTRFDTGGARGAGKGGHRAGSGTVLRKARVARTPSQSDLEASYAPSAPAEIATRPPSGRDDHASVTENPIKSVDTEPLSTLSIDVDTASYAQSRAHLTRGRLPPAGAVRIEEFINYFSYDYPQPKGEHPFTVTVDQASSPFHPGRSLVRVGLQGRSIDTHALPASNLVFLVDVSGSMYGPGRLPLLKQSFKLLVDQLRPQDTVAIVVYAGAAGVVLPPTSGAHKAEIVAAIDRLEAGGSTAGGAGINLAYWVAQSAFLKGGNNRIILATDGDFNVGVSSEAGLVELIEEKRKTGVFLSILGFGMGNYQDAKMQKLAQAGNGNGSYIDSLQEAHKVLVSQMAGTLHTIAKDVKLQVEFNPARVKAYRLVGYETRTLRNQDFNDDLKDAGEMGAGHSVTTLYEIIPADSDEGVPGVDPLKYQAPAKLAGSDELLTVKVRYKAPDGDTSRLLNQPLSGTPGHLRDAPRDLRFAAAVAGFAMHLQGSEHKGQTTLSQLADLAGGALGDDREGYRAELITLIERAIQLTPPTAVGLAR